MGVYIEDGDLKALGRMNATAATDSTSSWSGIALLKGLYAKLGEVILGAGSAHIGQVGSPADVISVTPTIDTNAYTSGDAVGGKQTITSAMRESGGKAVLESITVQDKGNQKAALTILFFDADPTAATITNNAAFVFSTDISKVVGRVNITAADYETIDSKAIACVKAIGLEMKASGSANLFAAVVTTGTPTYVSASDLTFKYGFLQS